MSKDIKSSQIILVTGSNGLVGSAIQEESKNSDHTFVFSTRQDADLTKKTEVDTLFDSVKPDVVIHTAAKVGGIAANKSMQESFFYENILINANVIRACIEKNVQKLLAFSSVCVFPDDLALLEEDRMHDGPVYDSNFAYGYAKRMVDVQIRAAEAQYGVKNWTSIIPGNIFGKHDMFSVGNGHIVPALIYKLFAAKKYRDPFTVWGDGKSLREFMYVNDLARVLLQLIDKDGLPNKILISGRKEYSIREMVDIMVKEAEFEGVVEWDTSKPNGQRSRPSSTERIDSILPDMNYTPVSVGIQETWNWFVENYPNVRTSYR